MAKFRRRDDRHNESTSLPLFDGPIQPEQHDISLEFIVSRPTMLHALNFAQEVSGIPDKQIADALDLDTAQLSRIKSGNAHFPPNKLAAFMRTTGNTIPLQWLAHTMGFELKPLRSELEKQVEQLRSELEESRREGQLMRSLITERKG